MRKRFLYLACCKQFGTKLKFRVRVIVRSGGGGVGGGGESGGVEGA